MTLVCRRLYVAKSQPDRSQTFKAAFTAAVDTILPFSRKIRLAVSCVLSVIQMLPEI